MLVKRVAFVPEVVAPGLVPGDWLSAGEKCPAFVQAFQLSQGGKLQKSVAQAGGFHWAGNHRETGTAGGHPAEQAVLSAAPQHMKGRKVFASGP